MRSLLRCLLAAGAALASACLPEIRDYCDGVCDAGPLDASVDGPDAPPPFVREVCVVGPAMPRGLDRCVDDVCTADPACCTLGWSEACVQRAAQRCQATIGTSGGRCPADVTLMGWDTVSTLRFRTDPTQPRAVHCLPPLEDTIPHRYTSTAAWADADGDGDLELAVAALGALRVFEGQGVTPARTLDLMPALDVADAATDRGETGYTWGSRVAWADADHDGDLDLAWYDEVLGLRVFRREPGMPVSYQPTWLIPTAQMPVPSRPVGLGWMQLDADLDLELVATRDEHFWFFDRQADGTWTAKEGPTGTDRFFVSTFDRLVTGAARVFYAGTLNLTPGPELGVEAPNALAWGDLEGDGVLDVIVASHAGVFWAPAARDGFQATRQISTAPGRFGAAIGDLDGDGRLDVLAPSHAEDPVVLLQREDRRFEAPAITAPIRRIDAQAVTLRGVEPVSAGLCQ